MSALYDFKRGYRQEVRTTASTPLLWFTGIMMPLFWCLVLAGVFATGLMRDIPVGLVDADNSAESRALVQALDAVPSVDFINYESQQAASNDLASAKIYGLFVIGPDWSQKQAASRSDSALELFLNKSYYAIATTLETDIKLALSRIQMQQLLQKTAATGGGFSGSAQRIAVLDMDVLIAGNPALNFRAYLLTTMIPGVLCLAAILTCVGALTREWRLGKTALFLQDCAHPRSFLLGRLAFWLSVYSVFGLSYLAWFAGWDGWGANGSLLVWAAAIILLMASMPALALLYTSLAPSWILAMSVAIGTTAPIFPFTGFSFPLDSMDRAAQILGQFLPLTWYVRLHSAQWVLASPLSHNLYLLGVLSLFVIVPAAIALLILPARMRAWAKKEAKERVHHDEGVPQGFFAVIRAVLAKGAFERDTFLIFLFAVAFYLVFYAWPYSAQTVTNVQTAVVDLDQSAASRRLIDRIRASSMVDLVAVTRDRAEGRLLYQTEKAAAVVTIPEDYEKDLLAGRHTFIAFSANGAYPVKARAAMADVAAIAAGETALAAAYNAVRAGAPLTLVKTLQTAPVSLVQVNLFNPLSGYASYIVPAVMPVIIQAVLLVSIVMSLGGWLAAAKSPGVLIAILQRPKGFAALFAAFWLFSLMWLAYALGPDFLFFDFVSLANPAGTLVIALLFGAAVVSFGLAFTFAMGTNAYGAQFFVIMSAPSLFVSGVVHPLFDMTPFALAVRLFIPTTPGITAFVAVSQNGSPLAAVAPQLVHLLVLACGYGLIAYFLWRRRAHTMLARQTTTFNSHDP